MISEVISVLFGLLGISWLYKIYKTNKWVKNNKKKNKNDNNNKKVYVLISVLDETKRIEDTVKYFYKVFKHINNFKIVLISTEAEYSMHDKLIKSLISKINKSSKQEILNIVQENTKLELSNSLFFDELMTKAVELVKKKENTIELCKRLEKSNKIVSHYHYPKIGGKMAHQLNYGIKEIIKKNGNCLFAVYNADSRPDLRTFDWVLSVKGIKVFQQYGRYFKNKSEFNGLIKSPLLWSAAAWQTRWALGFEINHAIKQFKFQDKPVIAKNLRYPLNYCIGHGLFFTTEIFNKLGGFSEDTYNEDAFFGLDLSYLNELIMPIPYYEEGDSPNTIKGLYIQKSTWFFGPLQAFNYMKKIRKKRKDKKLFPLIILTCKLFSHAIYWIIGPTALVLSLILALINTTYINIGLWFLGYFLFIPLPNYYAWKVSQEKTKKDILTFIKLFVGGLAMYLLHGLSAYKTLKDVIISKVTGKNVKKQKTPN